MVRKGEVGQLGAEGTRHRPRAVFSSNIHCLGGEQGQREGLSSSVQDLAAKSVAVSLICPQSKARVEIYSQQRVSPQGSQCGL